MYRALIEVTHPGRAALSEEEAHHLVKVRRAKKGDLFIGLDGQGSLYRCSLDRDRLGWYGNIEEEMAAPGESPVSIILGQALIKKDKFEWVIQKATELGVREIVPLITFRTELQLEPAREERQMIRWNKILVEAVKQSGRTRLPLLRSPLPLEKFLTGTLPKFAMFLDEHGKSPLKTVLEGRTGETSCLVLVGPEGGWAEQDRALIESKGISRVHLGSRILRTETAGLTVLSILQYELAGLE